MSLGAWLVSAPQMNVHPRSSNTNLRAAMNDFPPPGKTILGTANGGPRLVIENVSSLEWESFARRSKPARERLGPLQPFLEPQVDAEGSPG